MINRVWPVMVLMLLLASGAVAQPRVEKNVVFGMYSGAALLMDVYRPVRSNGLGLIVIQGSGWYMPQRYDAPALKDDPIVTTYGRRFAEAGYTAFVINHRAAPRFSTRLQSRTHSAPFDSSGTTRARMPSMDVVSVLGAHHLGVISRLSWERWMVPGIQTVRIL